MTLVAQATELIQTDGPAAAAALVLLLLATDLQFSLSDLRKDFVNLDAAQQIGIGALVSIVIVAVRPFGIEDVRALAVPIAGVLLIVTAFTSGRNPVTWFFSRDGTKQLAVLSVFIVIPLVALGGDVVEAHLAAFPALGLYALLLLIGLALGLVKRRENRENDQS